VNRPSAQALPTRKLSVLGIDLAYCETGAGQPIVFVHGNPTSSYLWRNIMPLLADQGRCIAIDLPGMGGSDKLPGSGPGSYRLQDHQAFFDAALESLGATNDVTLVLHDWGTALGFDWARRNEERVLGLAYMEGIVRPVTWDEWPEPSRPVFQGMRSAAGEAMVLEKNVFVERILPGSIIRKLEDAEMASYRAPYTEPGESRRPMLSWPRALPIDGEPADVVEIVQRYAEWLSTSDVPKLFINAEPGAILVGAPRDFCRTWPNQTEITVPGIHFIQEDSPTEIAEAIGEWRKRLAGERVLPA
jgi:haloalkane dehalogenase